MSQTPLSIKDLMTRAPVIPVLAIDSIDVAVPLAHALVAGGLPVLEITLRTDCALAAVEAVARAVPQAIVGVGTCTRADDLKAAEQSGAQFLVSPGLTEGLIEGAKDLSIPLLPGVATASELMRATDAGFEYLKFFPAQSSGGVAALKAFAGPFPQLRFCPTGGISPQNLADYLALPNVLCAGGSWLAPSAAVRAGDWEAIRLLAVNAAGYGPG